MQNPEYLDRQIIIGMIVSKEYLQAITPIYSPRFIEDATARRLADWCLEYYKQFDKAPGKSIKDIFYEAVKDGLPEDIAEEIEEDVLPGLSEEYTSGNIDIPYLTKRTKKHWNIIKLRHHTEKIKDLIDDGLLTEAEKQAREYAPMLGEVSSDKVLDLASTESDERVIQAFCDTYNSVISYPRQLGDFINHQLVKGAFVAFLAPEKRGKTFLLLDLCMTAVRQGKRVAFFQAGDMNEMQQIKRICIYLAGKSNLKKYCGEMFEPVRDCVHNQRDTCDKPERECDFGVFETKTIPQLRDEITLEELKEALQEFPDYKPCWNCQEYFTNKWGTPWIKKIDVGHPLTDKEALKHKNRFFKNKKNRFKLATYPNSTLTVTEIGNQLDRWALEGFVPDLIAVDYPDIMIWDGVNNKDFRHSQNEIWKGLRAISQSRNEPCVIAPTQADADAYGKNRLGLKNFSEDKRKYAHVTAMYGMNQDKDGREKKIGILRLNELVVREGDFDTTNEIFILQNLKRGRPRLSSYF